MVGSTQICGHTNFVFGWKLGCDNNYVIASPTPPKQAVPTVQPSTPKLTPPPTFRKTGKIGKEEDEHMAKSDHKLNGWLVGNKLRSQRVMSLILEGKVRLGNNGPHVKILSFHTDATFGELLGLERESVLKKIKKSTHIPILKYDFKKINISNSTRQVVILFVFCPHRCLVAPPI